MKINKNSKFYIKDERPFSEKLKEFGQSMLFWRGRNKGFITTRNLEWGDLRYIFFPSKLDKYGYLGITFYRESEITKVLRPLVLAMDYEAKPFWCPRWFLRFLHVFGNDKSIVRVRNRGLHNLHRKLTKGIMFWDWKTKWSPYDLRISITGPSHLQKLADWIEHGFYSDGRQTELVSQIKSIDPDAQIIWGSVSRLEKQLEELQERTPDIKIYEATVNNVKEYRVYVNGVVAQKFPTRKEAEQYKLEYNGEKIK